MFLWLERFLTYKPDNKTYADVERFGFDVAELGTEADRTLVYSRIGTARPVILFLHGNRGNITFSAWYFELFERLGLSFAAVEYPGYGAAAGIPSEESLYRSARAAMEYLIHGRGIPEREIVLFGVSLGAALAVETAGRYRCAGLVLESAFNDSRSMGKHLVRYLPLHRFVPNRFANRDKIAAVKMPLLLMHGSADETTPVAFGLELFDRHPGPKEKLIVDAAGHIEIGRIGGDLYASRLVSFIRKAYDSEHCE